ncbi:MAG TPA: thermonuclease family protein [Nitrospiraceae bacterium]|nr:thermonuclease family protein [Nitrospiraceae bacterium]
MAPTRQAPSVPDRGCASSGTSAQHSSRISGRSPQQVLVYGKEVTLQTHGYDKYKRTLGDVILPDGMNLNQELVKQGWCWWYRKYASGDTVREGLEDQARAARKGLWADPNPVPPWEWRKKRG